MDVYLLDLLVQGALPPGTRILDAGCGGGRNLLWFLRHGYPVSAVDRSASAVEKVRRLAREQAAVEPAAEMAPEASGRQGLEERFRVAELDQLPFDDGSFDVVVCCAALHFATDEAHFRRMVEELWRVLAAGGLLFVRTASASGMDGHLTPLEDQAERRYFLPDGTERFLVDDDFLAGLERDLDAQTVQATKTVLVNFQRAMATWVVRKG